MGVTYRQASRDDLLGMAEVYLAAFPESVRHYFGPGRPPALAMADLLAIALAAESAAARVAAAEERVVGYCLSPTRVSRLRNVAWRQGHAWRLFWRCLTGRYGLSLLALWHLGMEKLAAWRQHRRDPFACEARILSIAVHPQYQGLGLGQHLLSEALGYLAGQRVPRVRLEVRPDNPAALHLYQKLGFVMVGHTRDSQGEWLIMLKDFDDGRERHS